MGTLRRFSAVLLLLPLGRLPAAETDMQDFLTSQLTGSRATPAKEPQLDPKRIINQSSSFLKDREPEMSAEEYALYDKMVALLDANADLAVQLLESMMKEKATPSPAFEFILGNAYYNAGKIDKAEAHYRSAVNRFPTFIRAWNNLGVLYYSAGKYADAIPCFSKSIVLGDRDPMTFGLVGYSLEKEEDYVSAELAFMQAIGGDPANTDWKEGLLRICIQMKQDARAEALVKKLIKDHPREPRYWLMHANILLSVGRKFDAMVVLEAAAGLGAAGPDELTLLGDLYAEQGLAGEAHAAYGRLLKISPEVGERRLLNYAQMLISSHKLTEAGAVLEGIAPKLSLEGRIPYLQARADLQMARKHWPEARKELDALLTLAPFNGRALLTVGRSYVSEGNEERAALAFQAALQAADGKYTANLELANLELRSRHYGKSVEYLEQALSLERTAPVEDYLARIKTLVVNNDASSP